MFQREVAERIVALPGSKNYSALSVMSQVFSDNKIVLRLPPGSFTPPPKVHSAIVRFELREPKEKIEDESVLQKTVASAFQKRRKMIQNALEVSPDILKEAGIAPEARPETVSAAQFIRLSNQISLK